MVFYSSDQPELYHGLTWTPAYHCSRIGIGSSWCTRGTSRVRPPLRRFAGGDFTREAHYEGPGDRREWHRAGERSTGPGATSPIASGAWSQADQWVTSSSDDSWNASTFLYLPDEPRPPDVLRRSPPHRGQRPRPTPDPGTRAADLRHAADSALALKGAIDIWCPCPRKAWTSRPRPLWNRPAGPSRGFYNGGRPDGPTMIDSPATDPRARLGRVQAPVENYFFWHGVRWQHIAETASAAKRVGQPHHVRQSRAAEQAEDFGFINGDGVLIYPGEEVLHPEEDPRDCRAD